MTDENTTSTIDIESTAQIDQPEVPTDDSNQQSVNNDETEQKPSNREARYRRQLRETQAERDTLAARVEALQRAEVERIAADLIAKPTALWTAGVQLDTLTADDGSIDPARVTEAVKAARERLGLARSQQSLLRGAVVPREGTGTTHRSSPDNPWESAFKG